MKLLALDTCTEACSAALYLDGELRERYEESPRRHAELVLPMVEDLLAEAELSLASLDGIAFGRGPGAFTGLRIGCGVVQGLAFGAELPVAPVSSLAALAQAAIRQGQRRVLSAIDARMGEVYFAAYEAGDDGLARQLAEERVCAPEQVVIPEGNGWYGIGSGWHTYADTLQAGRPDALDGREGEAYPRAYDVALLGAKVFAAGDGVPAEQALPVYLRDKVAKKKGEG